jgi:hypothetical protein
VARAGSSFGVASCLRISRGEPGILQRGTRAIGTLRLPDTLSLGAAMPRPRLGCRLGRCVPGMTLPQPAEVDDFTHAGFLRAPTSPMQGIVMSHITLTAADGHTLGAWRTGPDTARRGLVVVQEIFGVNGHMRRVCE